MEGKLSRLRGWAGGGEGGVLDNQEPDNVGMTFPAQAFGGSNGTRHFPAGPRA